MTCLTFPRLTQLFVVTTLLAFSAGPACGSDGENVDGARGGTAGTSGTAGMDGQSGNAGTNAGGTSGSSTGGNAGSTDGAAGTTDNDASDASRTDAAGDSGAGCPATVPGQGAACSPDGQSCGYVVACVGAWARCFGGKWDVNYDSGLRTCPYELPESGAPCDCGNIVCPYNRCSLPNPTLTIASCEGPGSSWSVASSRCID